ncbi:hypothetical protein [Janthinobacterium sp.]|uniref:hypothetical protein n=1 Tax=Janthinobacterium sp. TaxID=1871054 RepID=UPI00293D6C74|nr:hypothetical protein [Janthinobacterium sp.]
MTPHPIDFNSVRTALRAMNRGSLLIIAERAIELLPATQLSALLGDFVQLAARPDEAGNAPASLLDEVRSFHEAAMDGEYYETVEINNRARQEQSHGTDAFISEFDRLLRMCVRADEVGMPRGLHDSFELLLGLLRHIDEGNDDVLFFADDSSSLDVGVSWQAALPVYFRCLAKTSSPEEFARTVDETIIDFVGYDRPRYMNAARDIASDAQRIALDALMT